jgi:hypothetical protein
MSPLHTPLMIYWKLSRRCQRHLAEELPLCLQRHMAFNAPMKEPVAGYVSPLHRNVLLRAHISLNPWITWYSAEIRSDPIQMGSELQTRVQETDGPHWSL